MENKDVEEQKRTPYLDALKKYVSENVSPFDVPGHHMGNVENDFKDFVGDLTFKCDVNAPRGLDNLNHPHGVILEAQSLMAKAFGADEAFFLINGTSAGIMAMILSCCSAHQKIIVPRNCHKSCINGLVLSGATPIFISPQYDFDLEIANQPTIEDYKKAIDENPDTRAIFVINPTYFGAVLNLKELVDYAHERNILVLADEAHGCHFGFNEYGPMSAIKAGCDLSAVSFHKTGGSLTQSSVLLRQGERISHYEISKALALINTTSPSTLLIASLDAARKYMAINGQQKLLDAIELTRYAVKKINEIDGFKARDKSYFINQGAYDYDETKIVIELDNLDIDGFTVYKLLKDEYNVQMELAETYVILAIIAIGSKKEHVEALINALEDIARKHYKKNITYPKYRYDNPFPKGIVRPRTAYHAPLKIVPLEDAKNLISKESIMIYPPGIPLIIPGEVFTDEIIKRIIQYKKTNATVLSDYENDVSVIDFETWDLYEVHKKDLEEYYESIKIK
ncbi:MAG: aminotransferase class I/II-fold pyridoxal phosphate-dependent enzyme [Bacillales bacterium]|nr:aminotransferase class I/II-fold pyridoxal phosphate-dependent enzyme [Bacillales bacterium]